MALAFGDFSENAPGRGGEHLRPKVGHQAIALQRSLLRQGLHHRVRMLLLLSAGRTAHGVHGGDRREERGKAKSWETLLGSRKGW